MTDALNYWWRIDNGHEVTSVEFVTVDGVGDGGPGWDGQPEVFYDGPPNGGRVDRRCRGGRRPMTNPNNPDGGPAVEVWIEDTPGGQALFVTTTTSDGQQATAALWQPTNNDSERTGDTDAW